MTALLYVLYFHAELKTVLSTIRNNLIHEFIDKAIVSFFCNSIVISQTYFAIN